MPDPRPLTLCPEHAAALAEAEPGEVVRVWAAMERRPPELHSEYEWAVDDQGQMFAHPRPGAIVPAVKLDGFVAPAALGERVEVRVDMQHEEIAATNPLTGSPFSFRVTSYETAPATVVTAPEPGRWCSACEGRKGVCVFDECPTCGGEGIRDAGGWPCDDCEGTGMIPDEDPCPTCGGDPPWGWWVELRKEGA